jgi:hypothetical protein
MKECTQTSPPNEHRPTEFIRKSLGDQELQDNTESSFYWLKADKDYISTPIYDSFTYPFSQ